LEGPASSSLSFIGDAYLNERGITNRLLPTDVTTVLKTTKDPEDVPDDLGLADIRPLCSVHTRHDGSTSRHSACRDPTAIRGGENSSGGSAVVFAVLNRLPRPPQGLLSTVACLLFQTPYGIKSSILSATSYCMTSEPERHCPGWAAGHCQQITDGATLGIAHKAPLHA
jgi:hypothetical protein